MRVISGIVRGLTLKTIKGDKTRPTRDIVKEALFSILMNKVPNSKFLDLFAGSGAVGIEALSRGADIAYFADINPECIKVINHNIEKTKINDNFKVIKGDYREVIEEIKNEKFDIIFIDPPYNKKMGIDAITKISDLDILDTNGIIVYETDEDEDISSSIGIYERFNYKKYGRNILNFYRRKE